MQNTKVKAKDDYLKVKFLEFVVKNYLIFSLIFIILLILI